MDDLFTPSKYPEIIIDKKRNSALNANKILSLEEYNDLMHHTHDASTLIMGSGSSNSTSNIESVINELNQTINNLSQTIESLTGRINTLENYVDNDMQLDINDDNTNTNGDVISTGG